MKQTHVRVIEQEWSGEYKHYIIEILRVKPDRFMNQWGSWYLDVEIIGSIRFQTDRKKTEAADKWYGMKFKCETERPEDLLDMAKIAKYVRDNRSEYWSQPAEILQLLNAVYYITTRNDIRPATDIGKSFYKIYHGEKYYTYMISANETTANKAYEKWLTKHTHLENLRMEFSHIITAGFCEKISA